jgi:hypothetical protein
VNLRVEHDRLPPVRGLITTHTARGRAIPLTTLKKWLRFNAEVCQCAKLDVLVPSGGLAVLPELLAHARHAGIALSLRTAADTPPPPLTPLREAGLLDLFVTPTRWDQPGLLAWLSAARVAGLPVRAQLSGPLHDCAEPEMLADALGGCCVVNIAAHDPFVTSTPCANRTEAGLALRQMNMLTRALAARAIEVNLLHLPFAWVDEENLRHAAMSPQFFLDHQQYRRRAYILGVRLHSLSPRRIDAALEVELTRQTSVHNKIDDFVLPWILERPGLYFRLWAWHKLTRRFRWSRHRPQPLPEGQLPDAVGAQAAQEATRALAPIGADVCRFYKISDHNQDTVRRFFPGVELKVVEGPAVQDLLHFLREQPKYYDAIDEARLAQAHGRDALAAAALQHANDAPPTREISADAYDLDGHETHHMPGAVRWFSFANAELQSTVLDRLEPPFTLGLTFGGGFAAQIGFSFGRHAKVLCPMIAPTHRLLLHVAEDGQFALLRDGEPVRPTEFEDAHLVPGRLGGVLEPRISVWNVDGQLLTQTLLVWEQARTAPTHPARIKHSVIVVSTFYARRLQAVLLGLAHQRDFDLSQLEVILAYVPGIDATDDLIDTMRRAFPALRIVRSPFPKRDARSKGFMINESLRLASGAWITLLDSDIVLPPKTYATIERLKEDTHFIALDGRTMLSPEITARILLGEVRPWECYETLAAEGGEHRARESDGIPIGFFQCVRREVFDKIQYIELDHFEGSDWFFGKTVVGQFGPETRLPGLRALHLDHGGSQWFGAGKQM